jgi:hypothetical protein
MITRSNVRLGLTAAILMMALSAFSACTDSPMEPELSPQMADNEECVIINGIIHCAPTRVDK